MGMTPDKFFEAFVQGNYYDFEENQGCVRCAFNAAIAAFHMLDHYYNYCQRYDEPKVRKYENRQAYMEHAVKETKGYFQDIKSIANAYKHLYVGEDRYSSISSAGTVEVVRIEDQEISEIEQEHDEVWFTRKTGERLKLLPCLKKVVHFWEREL